MERKSGQLKNVASLSRQEERISPRRAANALGVESVVVGHNYMIHHVIYLNYYENLYLTFRGFGRLDAYGTIDSPILQNESIGGNKSVWTEFREITEKRDHTTYNRILFGMYRPENEQESFLDVMEDPIRSQWLYTEKSGGEKTIKRLFDEEAARYQEILDEIRYNHEEEYGRIRNLTAEVNEQLEESRKCREEAIETLNSRYQPEFERFTFNETGFRFRQFSTEFLYTPEGLERFYRFYERVALPYKQEEIAEKLWKDKAKQLMKDLTKDEKLGRYIREYGVTTPVLKVQKDNKLNVSFGLIDDRTGREFSMIVEDFDYDNIFVKIAQELSIIFHLKDQRKLATATLQRLAAAYY